MLNQIRNYVQLTPSIGTSGQPTVEQFSAIATTGYQCIINLAMPDSDNALSTEGSVVTALGMVYVHIPVPFDHPTSEHLRAFINVMDAFDEGKIWVHCAMNYRVSAFLYHYLRVRKGYGELAARSPIFEIWQPNQVWQTLLALDSHEIGL